MPQCHSAQSHSAGMPTGQRDHPASHASKPLSHELWSVTASPNPPQRSAPKERRKPKRQALQRWSRSLPVLSAPRAPPAAFRQQMPRQQLALRRGVASMCRHPWALCSPRHILAWKAKNACAAKSNWSRTASRQTECDCARSWRIQGWLNLTHSDGETSELDSKEVDSDVPRDIS